jgi:hypothetical protein
MRISSPVIDDRSEILLCSSEISLVAGGSLVLRGGDAGAALLVIAFGIALLSG